MALLVVLFTLSMQSSAKYQPSARSQLIPSRTIAEGASEKLMEYGGYFNTTFAGTTGPLKEAAVSVAFTPDTMLTKFILCILREHTGEQQQAEEWKPRVSFKMISPAQATLEQAKS